MAAIVNTTKTYQFNLGAGDIILESFSRLGVRPSEITQAHMLKARWGCNLLLSEWSNTQPNLWTVGLQSIPLIQGTATYSIPAETVMILDAYLSYGTPSTDQYLYAMSRTEYASLSTKTQQGRPSQFWYDRLISPTITFYLVPDGNGPYVVNYYSVRQNQDVALANGTTVEIPFRFLEAFCAGLAWKLAEAYRPELEDKLFARYQRQWGVAATQDTENVPMFITPGIGGYFRP